MVAVTYLLYLLMDLVLFPCVAEIVDEFLVCILICCIFLLYYKLIVLTNKVKV